MTEVVDRIKKHHFLLFCTFISLLTLGICSKSSPLYPMNDWVDVNCFFTVGKSMLDGQVLYRDLYEQKGPVLYFIYALCALLSDTDFWSVFLLEAVSFTVFLYFSGKIIRLYTKAALWPYLAIAVLALLIGTTPSFCHGGSVEEMCLGLLVYGLYCLLRCSLEKRCLRFREALVNGIFAGMILWAKFTVLGFYVGLCLAVLIWYAFFLKDGKGLWKAIGAFLLGMGAVTAVVLLYFVCTGALEDLYTAYFYNNLFLYPADSDVSKLEQIKACLKWGLHYNPNLSIPIYLGALWLVLRIYKHPMEFLCGVLCFLGLAVLTYWGGRGYMQGYGYYDLILAAFCVFGFAALGQALSEVPWYILSRKCKQTLAPGILCITVLLSAVLCLDNGRNTYLMDYEKEDMPQYKFAEIISQVEDPTLLNYGFLDGGFYHAAQVIPNCRFFCTFNVSAPDMWQTQWDQLWAGDFDFVVTRYSTLPETFTQYELVSTAEMMFENIDFTYYLYQRKDTIQ